jgi:hemoglobin/transferrin/lactoferrin receptor protein
MCRIPRRRTKANTSSTPSRIDIPFQPRRLALRLLACGLASTQGFAGEQVAEEVIVTARQVEEAIFETPYSVDVIGARRIERASFRSTPDIFREVPGTLVQKTGHGQGSPYIRGFTGYRNLFMIDGIRLNNSVFRDGPNQYWATVDAGSLQRLEVVRGPQSVLYGSDAIGGAVNALIRGPSAYRDGKSGGGLYYRYAEGEDSHIARGHADLALTDSAGLFLGVAGKDFGDIESGNGTLPNTGYDEWSLDSKLVWEIGEGLKFTAAHSQVHQDNAPRTHKTLASQSFAGTTIGSEISRNLDQDRILTYLRLDSEHWGSLQDTTFTLFHNHQEEERNRLRSRNRYDQQGFEVNTYGFNFAASLPTEHLGILTAGLDWAHDEVDSFSSGNPIQGPVADDSSYDWVGLFLQTRYALSDTLDLTAGLRLGYFEVDAGSIASPIDGSEFSYQQDWSEPVGNIRLSWMPIADELHFYGGISQGFRAPNLSDLTRFDSARSNEFEIPSVGLKPEKYVSYELGARYTNGRLLLEGSTYYTDIEDQIQRLATGEQTPDGEEIITKANVGDGELYGVEAKFNWSFSNDWLAFGHYAWLDGEISTEARVGEPSQDDNHSRMMPTNYRLGLRYSPESPRNWWLESEVVIVDDANKLSMRDAGDTDRIPPGGTPDYTLWHIRGGVDVSSRLYLNLVLENLTDEDYRVHGSGQNESGRSVIVALDFRF